MLEGVGIGEVKDVVDTIEGTIAATARALEGWCLTPPEADIGLRAVLHPPPGLTVVPTVAPAKACRSWDVQQLGGARQQ